MNENIDNKKNKDNNQSEEITVNTSLQTSKKYEITNVKSLI
jgi:hypothetical protein